MRVMTTALPAECASGMSACSGRNSALGMTAWPMEAVTPRRLLPRLLLAPPSQALSHLSSHLTSSESFLTLAVIVPFRPIWSS